MQRRDRYIAQSLGIPLTQRVKDSRVLLVGAGGIGCELLKNLVCCGFGTSTVQHDDATNGQTSNSERARIVVVDLDTIDLSNLNRQFLFRKHHIKRPKATVAKETATQFNPAARIDAHHASIFDKQYNVDFFESFDIVFNALDNLAARRHVNRMCLAAKVPLIESGTTGFNGQVQVIYKDVTECYDCNPKPVQKSFPICTIRSTPSQPIHCIVWAKSYLLPELFGDSEESSDSNMVVTEGDNADEVAKLQEEAAALKKVRGLMGQSDFAGAVFNKVFHDDIERLRSMSEMWQSRKPPEALGFENLKISDDDDDTTRQGQTLANNDQAVWNLKENVAVFCYSLEALSKRVQGGEAVIEFDKDDKDTLDFVASAANLRSYIFDIPLHSEWDIKQMAGNIIPAIATSNALTASLCVLQAFKIMKVLPDRAGSTKLSTSTTSNGASNGANGHKEPLLGGAKMVFLNSRSTDRLIVPQGLVPPNKSCPVCSPYYAKISIPTQGTRVFTLQDLVDLVKSKASLEEFSIMTDAGVIYDPDLDDNVGKSLTELGIDASNNGFVTIVDDGDEAKVDLVLSVSSQGDNQDADSLHLSPESIELPSKPPKAPVVAAQTNGDSGALGKRKRDADDDPEVTAKKSKPEQEDGVVVVDDDGAILLDDD